MDKKLFKKFEAVRKQFGLTDRRSFVKRLAATTAVSTALAKGHMYHGILKADMDRGLVTGPILIPENFDLQEDIVSAFEIEKSIHNYMIKLAFQNDVEFLDSLGLNSESKRGFQHIEFNRKIAFVEMFLVNDDRGGMIMNGIEVVNGTAIGTAKIFDEEVKNLVRAGRITGFSIGGRSKVIPA